MGGRANWQWEGRQDDLLHGLLDGRVGRCLWAVALMGG